MVKHDFFQNSVHFSDSRFTFEHIAAQMCLITLQGKIGNIKDADLNKMYEENKDFDEKSDVAKRVKSILDYLFTMFPTKTPELKRYNVISLYILLQDFETNRAIEMSKPQGEQDSRLVIYHEKTSHSTDALDSLTYRNEYLKECLLESVNNLPQKDTKRLFDSSQRIVIYRKNNGICQKCGKKCDWNDYEADHIISWNRGGKTEIENGQVLCGSCNSSKGDSLE